MPKLIDTTRIIDSNGDLDTRFVRDTFDQIDTLLQANLLRGFDGDFFSITFDEAGTNVKVSHELGFVPIDVIHLSVVPDTTTVTYNTDSFDSTDLDITVDAACTVRALIGRFKVDE